MAQIKLSALTESAVWTRAERSDYLIPEVKDYFKQINGLKIYTPRKKIQCRLFIKTNISDYHRTNWQQGKSAVTQELFSTQDHQKNRICPTATYLRCLRSRNHVNSARLNSICLRSLIKGKSAFPAPSVTIREGSIIPRNKQKSLA